MMEDTMERSTVAGQQCGVALNENALVYALEVARHNTGDIGKEIAIRAYLSAVGGEAGEMECDPDGCKAHIDAFMDRALKAESELARLKAQPGVVKALKAIAEGYPVRGEHDRYVVVENPDFRPDDGSDPNICVDTFALAAPVSQEPVAEQIADTVLSWMVKFDLLDAGNEYHASDVLAVLNDLAPSAAIGAGGQAVAVKPLEWSKGVVDRAIPLPGMKYVACSTSPEGAWAWWLEEAPETRAVFSSEQAAKAAAQADYERRIKSAIVGGNNDSR